MSAYEIRNFRLNVLDGIAFTVGNACLSYTAILPLFVSQYTDEKWILGLVTAVYMLGYNLPQLLGAASMRRMTDFWGSFKLQILLPRLALFAMVLTPWLPGELALWGFFLCFAAYSFTLGFQVPMWYEYLSHIIADERRGLFFGLRSAWGGVASLVATGLAGWLLAVLPRPWNFTACFLMGAIAIHAAYACIVLTRHDWSTASRRVAEAPPFWPAAMSLIRENAGFRQYVLSRVVISGCAMAMAFYVVHAQERFGLTLAQSSLLAIALLYLPSFLGLYFGKAADRMGNKWLQVAGCGLAAAANLVMLLPSGLPAYVLALFAVGCGYTVVTVLDQKWLMELDEARRGAVVSFFNLALTPSSALLPLAAGLVAQRFGMPAVFWLTALCWGVGGLMLAGIREARRAVPSAA